MSGQLNIHFDLGGLGGRGGSGGRGRGGRGSGQGASSSLQVEAVTATLSSRADSRYASIEQKPEKILVILSSFGTYSMYSLVLSGGDYSPNGKNIIPLEPIIFFDDKWPSCMAFLIKDSTLFMFGGSSNDKVDWKSTMYIYDLSKTLPFQEEHVRQGPNMMAPKEIPKAVLFCGMMCIYSRFLYEANKPNFEVYDPITSSWFQLPEPFEYHPYDREEVYCCYARNSSLYISTARGIYSFDFYDIDVCSHSKSWKQASLAVSPPPGRRTGLIIDNFYFEPYWGFDLLITSNGIDPTFGLLNVKDRRRFLVQARGDSSLIYLGEGKFGELNICTVRAGFEDFEGESMVPHLLVDVLGCLRSQSGEVQITKKKHFNFSLPRNKCYSINVASAFCLSGLLAEE